MAERKTRYTNADLKTGGPATEYGPWTQTDAGKARYDEIIGEPINVDEIIASAKGTLRNVQPLQASINDANRRVLDPKYAAVQQDLANAPKQFVRGVRENPISQGAIVAGSLIPSPLQPAFGGLLAADAAAQVVEQPSAMGALIAGTSALPLMSTLRGMHRASSVAREGKQVAEGLYRQTGMSRGSEVPYRMGSGVSTPPRASLHWTDEVPTYNVVDDAPVPQAAPVADELNDLIRASQAPLRRETARQQAAGGPSNVVRQRGTADIEAEMRAAGADDKAIRQLYHSSQATSKGVKVGGKPSKEEERIEQLLRSMGL